MLDNDSLTYKKRAIGIAEAKQAERALITLERSQKLDLLIHLLANLRQALIVCGPKGIGKTTLLQTLQANRKDQWRICLLQGSSALSFEAVVNSLGRFLNLDDSSLGFDLSALRAYCEKQKVVLIIDDAGELVPGLTGELIDFAGSLPGLRLVFSMTYDQFHIKGATDKAVDDCHFIELPPLSLKQCSEYLQNLSAQPGAVVSFNAVTDRLVEDLYRETHGIPGKILAEIPKLAAYQNRRKNRLGLWLGVAVIALAAGWTMKALLPSMPSGDAVDNKPPETAKPPVTLPPPAPNLANVETVLPAAETHAPDNAAAQAPAPEPEQAKPDIAALPAPAPAIEAEPVPDKAVEHTEPTAAGQAASEATVTPPAAQPPEPPAPEAKAEVPAAVNQAPEPGPRQAPVQAVAKTPESKPAKPAAEGGNPDWIMAQPPGNYTLQIMVLSNKAAADRFLKKYADYSDGLTYYAINSNGQEKYVLIYGSFKSAAEARQLKAVMPGEFKQALEKRFRAVQKESRR